MSQKIFQVDAFTNKPYAGNPAGVCVMDDAAPLKWMKNVAAEMNLSETAFLYPVRSGFNLRWFTPQAEVELCGHATLASAHILWEQGYLEPGQAGVFDTLSGKLTAESVDGWIKLDFPSRPPRAVEPPKGLKDIIGASPVYIGKNEASYMVEVESEEAVRNLKPDIQGVLEKLSGRVIVTGRSETGEFDFVSRFFAPGVGIDEDPVTGSAHCCLGPYWKDRLGKCELRAYQASSRGGELKVHVVGNRVHLFGQAVTVFEAVLK